MIDSEFHLIIGHADEGVGAAAISKDMVDLAAIDHLVGRLNDAPRSWAPISGAFLNIKFSEREIDVLVKALQKAAALQGSVVSEWQDISTAPKDGTRIVVHRPGAKRYPVVGIDYWSTRYTKPCWAKSPHDEQPALWQPLPAPPVTRQDGKSGAA
jgi:hypothetical protein